jgi:hypothetical protein
LLNPTVRNEQHGKVRRLPGLREEAMKSEEIDAELKNVQLEAAKLDLEIKRRDLKNRSGLLFMMLSNPVVIAAAIAAAVTISTAIISSIVSEHQKQLEAKNAASQRDLARQRAAADAQLELLKTESGMILAVIKTGDPDQAAVNLKFLVDTGLVRATELRLRDYLSRRLPGTGKVLPREADPLPINPPH